MRRSRAVLLVLVAAPLLAACTDDPPAPAEATASTSAPSPEPSDEPPATPSSSAAPAPGQIERPEPGTCAAVPESPEGLYSLPGIGTLRLIPQEGGLSVEARAENGWGIDSSSDGDGADVEFRRGDEDVDVEADLRDDGRLEIQVCDDDD